VGQEVDYVLTDREYQGTIYYKCKPAEVQQGGFQAPKPKDPDTGKHIMRMSVLKVAGDLAINGDIKLQEVLAYAQIFEQYVLTGTDTLSQFQPLAKQNLFKADKGGIAQNFANDAIKGMESDLPF
jgi:hypothetical protein